MSSSNLLFSISIFGLSIIESIVRWVNRLCVKSWHQTPSQLAKRDFESVCIVSLKFSVALIYHG